MGIERVTPDWEFESSVEESGQEVHTQDTFHVVEHGIAIKS